MNQNQIVTFLNRISHVDFRILHMHIPHGLSILAEDVLAIRRDMIIKVKLTILNKLGREHHLLENSISIQLPTVQIKMIIPILCRMANLKKLLKITLLVWAILISQISILIKKLTLGASSWVTKKTQLSIFKERKISMSEIMSIEPEDRNINQKIEAIPRT